MHRTLMRMATIGLVCAAALPAEARSTAQPGQTVGLAYGAPIDPGFYFTNTGSWGERADIGTQSWIDIPDFLWSTPWEIFGGRLQIHVAPNFTYNSSLEDRWGFTNFWGAAQLAWDLGDSWSISYLAGAYTDRESDAGVSSASFNERLGISYTGDNWNLSATILHGIQLDDDDEAGVNDYINLDLTAMKTFGNWQVGFVAFGSTDLSGLDQQSQFAVGGLIGYDFKRVLVQAFITQDITENNYGGEETRFWTRFRIPCKDEMDYLPLK
jgi:hypothetical protein